MSPIACPETSCNGCATQGQNGVPDLEDAGEHVHKLRSDNWFNRKDDIGLSALYIERYLNYGLTPEELTSGKPIIGIAQSGSDISPCNRHHIQIAKRVREAIRSAGGVALEFPVHSIQETSRRPTATLDRNLSYLSLVEMLYAYPFDGVVLLTGCDKTTPAALMAAATMNIPAICLNVGPMLNGYIKNQRVGSGTVVWQARELHAQGKLDAAGFMDMISSGTPSVGHCNTMGTASTMNALAEALGMALPGSAGIPAPYRERMQCAYQTGLQIVEMVRADRKPSDIMTREAFENAIVVNTAIGGSTNAPIHLNAIAKHIGVPLDNDDWDRIGLKIPLLVNVMPAGEMLMEEYHRAGALPAVMAELFDQGKIHVNALTCTGKTIGECVEGKNSWDRATIRAYDQPLKHDAGFVHLTGTLFDSAIMKTSVIAEDFRKEYLENPDDPNAFEAKVVVFDGPEDYNKRLESADIDRRTILVMRGTGPLGYPGAAEVVNMHPPGRLLKAGISSLPCIGDGRQSGTSGSPSILNASPEAADGGNLALLQDGDRLRVDLNKKRVDILLSEAELAARRADLNARGGYKGPESHTPWQDIFRRETGQLNEGMVLKRAVQFQRVAQTYPTPRDNH
ncbi:dihydroxy-acid and 6-phosphogluconate dehydratase [Aaosphaeria arxii CBS 175.79]|uniref:Dihydroxy-acid and 6-phosphogluconate dehydratase n=1 Tax=Aaosphaeria arxii CBS 175.79 TaxID=1450172 RepID=A0A6A5XXQ8_9PLEO|nr:dihydroxy-acid and 6-phosphogluconate dehydratase [Aaosphaeria arxii CBS 175.79]KAF2017607.1 dihydroxy-acid and 6-phosphogluconate dehydratase [Aaosphaeria arxii CBS 175.79]